MTDSSHGWDQILEVMPDAIARAIDRAGMLACYTTAPYFHEVSGKWIPTGDGRRVNLGLTAMANLDNVQDTLEIRPGYNDIADQQLAEHQHKSRVRTEPAEASSSASGSPAPEYTDPTVRGPDAVAQPEVTDDSVEVIGVPPDHPMSNGTVECIKVGAGISGSPRIQKVADVALLSVIDFALAIYEELPKTRKKRLQKQADALRELRSGMHLP